MDRVDRIADVRGRRTPRRHHLDRPGSFGPAGSARSCAPAPRGLGPPFWVDAPHVDLTRHVRVRPIPPPGDEAQLLLAVEELRSSRRLDLSLPLWEMWFLPGLPDGRVGLFMKLHHDASAGLLGGGRLGQRVMLWLAARQRWSDVYLANIPGPPAPLYLAGARMLELFPVVPLAGRTTLGVGALSYAGQLNVTVVADRDACPDVAVFADGIRAGLAELEARSAAPAGR